MRLVMDMTVSEAIESRLQIRPLTKRGLWKLSMADFRYKPEYMSVYELADLTGIDRSTILTWCKKGLKHIKGVPGHKPTKISLHHFVMWVLFKSKHKTMNGTAGRKWTEEELRDIDNANRSKIAKKVMKSRRKNFV